MEKTIKPLITVFLLSVFISCSSSLDTDDFAPDSDIEIFKGSAAQLFENYSDNLRPHPFTIKDLSRNNDFLNIDVTYGGGEGGCPPHLFVVNWDETIHSSQDNTPLVKLGLAHFLHMVDNCDALVEERLEIDLAELLDEQLRDSLSFTVTNLIDSTQVTFHP